MSISRILGGVMCLLPFLGMGIHIYVTAGLVEFLQVIGGTTLVCSLTFGGVVLALHEG